MLRLERELRRRGLTVRRLATRAGVHHTILSSVIRGRIRPSSAELARLATELGVSPDHLLDEIGDDED